MGQPGAKRGVGETKELVRQYALKGLSAAEIGKLLGITRRAAAQHMRRLRDEGELEESA